MRHFNRLLGFCCLVVLPMLGSAQSLTTIKGIIQTSNGEGIEFATLVLKALPDSNAVEVALTDENGVFELFDIKAQDYVLEVSHINYKAGTISVPASIEPVQTLAPITLAGASTTLSEVTVVSRVPAVERKIDRTVVNVEATPIADGGTALDILSISPGVTIGPGGNISLSGKDGVEVFINGKPSNLSGNDLVTFLESIQGDQLYQIEIMTNPPARYDAAGNAGIINIVTKKLKLRGINANFATYYRQGRYPIWGQSASFNYRERSYNLYGNVGYDNKQSFDEYDILRNLRTFETNELTTIYDQQTNIVNQQNSLNGRLGVDIFLSDRTNFGVLVSGVNNPGDSRTRNTTLLKDPSEILETTIIAPATAESEWQNLNANFNFQHRFDTLGRELLISADYVTYDINKEQIFENQYYDQAFEEGETPEEVIFQRSLFPQLIDIYSGQIDYVHPFTNSSRLDLGVKSILVSTDNNAQFFDQADQDWILDPSLSNQFLYDEMVHAAYINYNRQLENWEIQFGLRVEHTQTEGQQLATNETFERNFTQLFPTFYLQYRLGADQTLGLSYGRRIDRPDYADLNPFRFYLDQFTYEEGNPNLQPQLSHNIELSHSLLEGAVTTTAYFSRVDDVMLEVIGQNLEANETFVRPENLSTSDVYGVRLDLGAPITKSFSTGMYLNYFYKENSGIINDLPFTIKANTFEGIWSNQFKFGNGWTTLLVGRYSTKSISGTFIQQPYGMFAFSIKKKILNNNGSIGLTVIDAFDNIDFVANSQFQNIDIYVNNQWQTQTIRLSFKYKFQKGFDLKANERKGEIDGVKDRVKQRGNDK